MEKVKSKQENRPPMNDKKRGSLSFIPLITPPKSLTLILIKFLNELAGRQQDHEHIRGIEHLATFQLYQVRIQCF